VKPANIMLTPENQLYLIDFGIARTFKWGKTRDTTPLGSPGYAAPEQYGHAQTNRRADIYGLGATLQTLLTGRDPLELAAGETSRNPLAISPELRALLDEMLTPDQWKRPIDMRTIQTRLERIAPPQAEPEPDKWTGKDTKRFSQVIGLLVLFCVYGLASSVSVWLGFFYLANVVITFVVHSKWTRRLPYLLQVIVLIGRVSIQYLWVLFAIAWFIIWFFHLPLPPL
jgi:serine/threonine protein kinase